MKTSSRLFLVGAAVARRLSTVAAEATQPSEEVTLYSRLSALGATGGSISKTVNKYVREGKAVKKHELEACIKSFRKYKRYNHALELMEWMEKRGFNLSHSDQAVRLVLISKAEGVASAEKYFNSLSPSAKNKLTYGALLNCYCSEQMTQKALALFEKMNELKFAYNSLAYNNLMAMYMKLGMAEMVPPLLQEMEERNILPDSFTFSISIQSFAALKDLENVEKIMEKSEKFNGKKSNWTLHSNLAAIYVEAGNLEKSEAALRELEKRMNYKDRTAYHFLISLYACTSNLVEVNRVWGSLKSSLPATNNSSYLVMLQALVKLDDFDGLKKCFEEWESSCSIYDMRLTNIIIGAFLKREMVKEAELVYEHAVKRGSGPNFRTWEIFMDFFLRNCQIDQAMRCMEEVISTVTGSEWRPSEERVNAFLKHFEEAKDTDGAEEFYRMLEKANCINSNAFQFLLNTYIAAGKTAPEMRERMKEDEIEMNPELENLLERVCPDENFKMEIGEY